MNDVRLRRRDRQRGRLVGARDDRCASRRAPCPTRSSWPRPRDCARLAAPSTGTSGPRSSATRGTAPAARDRARCTYSASPRRSSSSRLIVVFTKSSVADASTGPSSDAGICMSASSSARRRFRSGNVLIEHSRSPSGPRRLRRARAEAGAGTGIRAGTRRAHPTRAAGCRPVTSPRPSWNSSPVDRNATTPAGCRVASQPRRPARAGLRRSSSASATASSLVRTDRVLSRPLLTAAAIRSRSPSLRAAEPTSTAASMSARRLMSASMGLRGGGFSERRTSDISASATSRPSRDPVTWIPVCRPVVRAGSSHAIPWLGCPGSSNAWCRATSPAVTQARSG